MIKVIKKPRLVGFSGRAGVGKTTTAEWFVREHEFVRLSFAKPLKECLSVLTGFSMGHFTDIELKEKEISGLNGVTPRILMQKMATEFIRDTIDPDFWLWKMRHMISEVSNRDIVIDDIRFPNEAQFIRDNGGKIIHLERQFESVTKENDHKSETMDTYVNGDIVVHSSSTIELTALKISNFIL